MPAPLLEAITAMVAALPLGVWRRIVAAAIVAAYFIALGLILRTCFLWVDVMLAGRARRGGRAPSPAVFATGYVGVALPWATLSLGAVFVMAEAVLLWVRLLGSDAATDEVIRFATEISRIFWW